jgi:hypothetical protein
MEIQWSAAASESCNTNNNNLYSCAIRRSIVAGVATPTNGAHDFALPDHSSDDDGCASFITDNLLGQNEFAQALATNMTALVRSKFVIDNYLRRAWYINPGYEWPAPIGSGAQVSLSLTDKMIAIAVVSIRESSTGIIRARRLLNVVSADQHTSITSRRLESGSTGTKSTAADKVSLGFRTLALTLTLNLSTDMYTEYDTKS